MLKWSVVGLGLLALICAGVGTCSVYVISDRKSEFADAGFPPAIMGFGGMVAAVVTIVNLVKRNRQ